MKRNLQRSLAICTMIALVLVTSACPAGTYRKILDAENGVAQSIGAGTDVVANLYDAQVIDRNEKNAVAGALLDANHLLDVFNKGAKALHDSGAESKTQYLTLADELSKGIVKLNASGTLHFKNVNAKATVDSLFASIQVSIGILKNAIQGAQ